MKNIFPVFFAAFFLFFSCAGSPDLVEEPEINNREAVTHDEPDLIDEELVSEESGIVSGELIISDDELNEISIDEETELVDTQSAQIIPEEQPVIETPSAPVAAVDETSAAAVVPATPAAAVTPVPVPAAPIPAPAATPVPATPAPAAATPAPVQSTPVPLVEISGEILPDEALPVQTLDETSDGTVDEPAPPPPAFTPLRRDLPAQAVTAQNTEVIFSRVVHVTVGQILEIPFRGSGWVYLGEMSSLRGIVYSTRRPEPQGMSFIFNVAQTGIFVLKFFREDFTRGYIINDYVQVIAGESTAVLTPLQDRSRITANPRWPSAVEESEIQRNVLSGGRSNATSVFSPGHAALQGSQREESIIREDASAVQPPSAAQQPAAQPQQPARQQPSTAQQPPAQSTQPSTVQQPPAQSAQPSTTQQPPAQSTQPSTVQQPPAPVLQEEAAAVVVTPSTVSPDVIMQNARSAFDGGNTAEAIALLDQFSVHYPGGTDEVYWMYGQLYEANTPSRNILLSLDYYRRLVNEFPQSGRLSDARRRIAYLERYYINIQ